MKTNSFRLPAVIAGIFVFALLFSGCLKNDEPAPNLPDAKMMVIDFTKFPSDEGKTTDASSTKLNFPVAAVNVGWWNTVLVVNLVIPVAAFYESFKHDADYNAALEKWTWSYNFNAGGWHTARLEATLAGIDEVHWEMYVSKAGSFTDFLWYSGNTKTDNSMATWQLSKDPTSPVPFIDIHYQKDALTGVETISYENIAPGVDNGSYIEYGLGTEGLNAFYNIYLSNGDNLVNIAWNTTTKEGRVKNLAHFGDEEWHCWDSTLEDVECE